MVENAIARIVSGWSTSAAGGSSQPSPGAGRRKGFEPPPTFADNPALLEPGGAESGAPATADPDLALLIAAWPKLPEPIRAGILAMIWAAGE
jgi:hypothetical protein